MLPTGREACDYREPTLGVSAPLSAAGAAFETDADGADHTLASEQRHLVVDAQTHGVRLDKVLVQMAPEFSRNHLQGLIERGHVLVDGLPASTASRRLKAGQRVNLELVPTEESRAFVPQAMPLVVLHEDDDLLVLDKPAGLVVHPAPGNWSGTLLNGLLAHHAGAASLPRAGIVHRLDKDTSGVMMVGKTLPAVTALVRAVAARSVQRRYLALAHGVPAQNSFSVLAPIGRDPRVRVRMAVVPVAAGGREARTDVVCLATAGGISALRCSLHTGRTHQIRVHLQSQGHPLLADEVYGGRPALGMQRQALHAFLLALAHPVSGQAMQFLCPPPSDFLQAWSTLDAPQAWSGVA